MFGGPEMGFGGAGKVFGALYESEFWGRKNLKNRFFQKCPEMGSGV